MRPRTTLILLLLLIGLGAYVYLVERPAIEEEARSKKLVDLDKDDVVELALRYADREMQLARTNDEWFMKRPVETRADTAAVNSLLGALANAETDKELEEVSDNLASYGLDTPLVTVQMKTTDGEPATLSVGKDTPFGSSTYVRRGEEQKVLITKSTLRYAVDKQVKDLRDKTILSFEDDDVREIDIRGTEGRLRLTRAEGDWRIVEPTTYTADQSAVRTYLSSLRSLRALDFPEDDPNDLAPYGLDEPRLSVRLTLSDEKSTEVRIGDEAEESQLYATVADRPTVYAVSDYVFGNLDKSTADLRDKTLLAFDADALTALRITRQDGTATELAREEGRTWTLAGDDGKPAQSVIEQYVDDLQELKGYEIAADDPTDLAEFGLHDPFLRLAVVGAEDAAVGTVLIGKYTDGDQTAYAAMTEGGRTVFRVRDYLVTRLDKPHTDFVEAPEQAPAAAEEDA